MTQQNTPAKSRNIPRTVHLAEQHSRLLDRAANRLGITFSATLNLFLAGELDVKKFTETPPQTPQ